MDFSDDFFEETGAKSHKTEDQCSSYTPRHVNPQWFSVSCTDNTVNTTKRHADFLYYQKDFLGALDSYKHCLSITTSQTPAIMRREVEESIALCLAHLDRKEEAEQSLTNVMTSCSADNPSLDYHIRRVRGETDQVNLVQHQDSHLTDTTTKQ